MQRNWQGSEQGVTHVFTHFTLELSVFTAQSAQRDILDGIWVKRGDLADYALPSLMIKVAKIGLG